MRFVIVVNIFIFLLSSQSTFAQGIFDVERVEETVCTNSTSPLFGINGKKYWNYIIHKETFEDTEAFEAFLADGPNLAKEVELTFEERSWVWLSNIRSEFQKVEDDETRDTETAELVLDWISPLRRVEQSPKVHFDVISNPMKASATEADTPYAYGLEDLINRSFTLIENNHEELKGTQDYRVTLRAYIDFCVTGHFAYRPNTLLSR